MLSLLQNDLGVPLPLHISLSRPLVLKTYQKESFLQQLKTHLDTDGSIKSFTVRPRGVTWHSNEVDTRWFLVLRLESSKDGEVGCKEGGIKQLQKMLGRCNDVAAQFGQPVLYAYDQESVAEESDGQFHISIAWSLHAPPGSTRMSWNDASRPNAASQETNSFQENDRANESGIPSALLERLCGISIAFAEVKVRIGQDVHRLPLKIRRRGSGAVS